MHMQCSWRHALSDLFDVIGPSLEDPGLTRPMFVIGCGCSPRTEPVSQVTQFLNMLSVSAGERGRGRGTCACLHCLTALRWGGYEG